MIFDRRTVATAALACLILGGCDKKPAEGNKAAGEVLEGSISDAMIATDETRAEPPLAPYTARAIGEKGEKAKGKVAADGETGAVPAPDVSPTADAAPVPKPATNEPAG